MPRELRIQYPGAIYHVLNRGDQREDIFLDDEDRQKFLGTLEECCGNGYLRTVCDYVHLSPVRAKLLGPEQPLQSFAWSSYVHYLNPAAQRPGWLRVDRLLGEKGIPRDSEVGREMFALQTERRRAEESSADYRQIQRSWFVGSEQFRQELLAMASQRVGLNNWGAERQESDLQRAERIVRDKIRNLGWAEQDLRAHRKGDQRKVRIARRLRRETTMSLKRIAQRLQMGSWTYVSNLLHGMPAATPQCQQQLLLRQ